MKQSSLGALLASASPTTTILDHNFPFVEEKSANGNRLKTRLSHVGGSVQADCQCPTNGGF
jgi:hypothetical protein